MTYHLEVLLVEPNGQCFIELQAEKVCSYIKLLQIDYEDLLYVDFLKSHLLHTSGLKIIS